MRNVIVAHVAVRLASTLKTDNAVSTKTNNAIVLYVLLMKILVVTELSW